MLIHIKYPNSFNSNRFEAIIKKYIFAKHLLSSTLTINLNYYILIPRQLMAVTNLLHTAYTEKFICLVRLKEAILMIFLNS